MSQTTHLEKARWAHENYDRLKNLDWPELIQEIRDAGLYSPKTVDVDIARSFRKNYGFGHLPYLKTDVKKDTSNQKYRDAAARIYPDVEVDDEVKVSRGDDPGAYVQVWVWVPDTELSL